MDGVLDRLSIRSKIAVILIVPVLACAVLGGLRVSSRISTSRQADRVSKLTEFSLSGTHLAHELQQERGWSQRYLDELKTSRPANGMLKQRPQTDKALGAFRARVDDLDIAALAGATKAKLSSVLGRLSSLPTLRRDIDERMIASSGALTFYNAAIADVLNINRELADTITDRELAQSVGAFVDLSRIRELTALERELISGVLAGGRFQPGQYRSFTSMLATRGVLLSQFSASATPAQRAMFTQAVVGPEVQRVSELEADIVASEGTRRLALDPDQWWQVTTADLLLMHGVEQGFGGAAVARSRAIEGNANSRAAGDSLVVLLAVALAVGLSLLVARSMLRPLRLLEATAKDVATNRLPGVVRKLQRSPTQQSLHLAEELEPVDVPSRDEIGEVAAAFNAVHQVAVQVAAEQAALRTSIGEMFLNLARRSQSLIDRQIELIDDLEEEADAQTLGNLFQLDHLATRMRRNAENLIVLSGAEPPRRWAEPIPLPEVVRGAVAEVEDYQRVALLPMEDLGVPGHAVADLIHLLAELIENATSFSPPGTAVRIGGQRAAGGYVLEIEDRGLGMTDDELLQANQRLANPPAIDFAVSRMLGLFVVGRLAQRLNLRVQLRHSSYGGVTALVLLPASLLIKLEPEAVVLASEPSPQLAVPAPTVPPRPAAAAPPPPPPVAPVAPPQPLRPPHPQPHHPQPHHPEQPRPARPEQPHPAPARADRLPIFEQARSEWFESGIGAEHGPPQHHSAYPPLAARFQSPAQQPPVGQGPPTPPVWGAPPAPPPRPSRAVDDAATELPRRERFRGGYGFASVSVPPDAPASPRPPGRPYSTPDVGDSGPTRFAPQAEPAPPPQRHQDVEVEVEVEEPELVEVTPLPPMPPFPRRQDAPRRPAPAVDPDQQATAAGLPRRIPRANLAPGILEQREQAATSQPSQPSQRLRSPEEVRSLLATYRAGLQRGRDSAASGRAGWPSEPATGWPPQQAQGPSDGVGGEDDEAR
jgi:HAMP domain-containing protein